MVSIKYINNLKCLKIKDLSPFYFPITVDMQYFTLASGYSTLVRHLHKLWSDLPDKSSTHLAPYIVIISWIIFLMVNLNPHDCTVTTNLYFLIPSPFSPISPTTLPTGNHQFVLWIYESVCFIWEIIISLSTKIYWNYQDTI